MGSVGYSHVNCSLADVFQAWRIPIIAMQIYPVLLISFIYRLPESPRWWIFHNREDDARVSLVEIYGEDDAGAKLDELKDAAKEESAHSIGYSDMIFPGGQQFHETMVTVMGQVNQALTGYGAVSVYGAQIFELLGFDVSTAEYLTQGNFISYFFLMTFAWLLIDRVGRRFLMVTGAFGIAVCFALLTVLGGLATNSKQLGIPNMAVSVPGSIALFVATGLFGIGWLAQVWLIPTEIYPSTSRAQGSAISVIIWGLANFAVTLLTPIGFNNLNYWLFLIFTVTNLFAGWWTWVRQLTARMMRGRVLMNVGVLARNGRQELRGKPAILHGFQRTQHLARHPRQGRRIPSSPTRKGAGWSRGRTAALAGCRWCLIEMRRFLAERKSVTAGSPLIHRICDGAEVCSC